MYHDVHVGNFGSIVIIDVYLQFARRSVVTGYELVVLSGPQTKSKLVVIFHREITLTLINPSN